MRMSFAGTPPTTALAGTSAQITALVPTVRVLYMSGYTDDAPARHGSLDAPGTFLEKPFSVEDLIEKVRAALASGVA